jgi:TPR repeat protein
MMDDFEQADAYLDAGDGAKAMPIFHRLAEGGRVSAMHSIAHTHLYGIAGIKQDYDAAFLWFTRAANGGCPQGMYHLGMCNAKGYGTPIDPELSFQWYKKSAERGDEDAMYEVGQCYERGFGVQADMEKAKAYYREAAADGQEPAAKRLAELG